MLKKEKKDKARNQEDKQFCNSTSPEIIWGLGGPEEDHQLHHCCWTGCVGEREEEVELIYKC